MQEHVVDDAEHARVGPDGERQCGDGRERDPWAAPENAEAMAEFSIMRRPAAISRRAPADLSWVEEHDSGELGCIRSLLRPLPHLDAREPGLVEELTATISPSIRMAPRSSTALAMTVQRPDAVHCSFR